MKPPSHVLKWTAALTLCLMLTGCWLDSAKWDGWVYPDAEDRTASMAMIGFDSFEICREAAMKVIASLENPKRAGWICARNCRWDPEWKNNVCDGGKGDMGPVPVPKIPMSSEF